MCRVLRCHTQSAPHLHILLQLLMLSLSGVKCPGTAARSRICHICVAPSAFSSLIWAASAAEGHDRVGHPETAARIWAAEQALACSSLPLRRIQSERCATLDELLLVHPSAYQTRLQVIREGCLSCSHPEAFVPSTAGDLQAAGYRVDSDG